MCHFRWNACAWNPVQIHVRPSNPPPPIVRIMYRGRWLMMDVVSRAGGQVSSIDGEGVVVVGV
jgi:hypothetical protein